jgi:hypothetical protein
VIPLDLIREYVNDEIPFIESRQTLYDVFFLLLKDQGRSYQNFRRSWIDTNSRQLDLFNGYRSP